MKHVKFIFGAAAILILTVSIPLHASEIGKGVKITYLGHAAFKMISPKGVVIYIDPFLSKNPKTPPEMKTVDKADLILVTHGHGDHLGDTLAIAEKTNAEIVAIAELGRYLKGKGAKNVVGMNKGGNVYYPQNRDYDGSRGTQLQRHGRGSDNLCGRACRICGQV